MSPPADPDGADSQGSRRILLASLLLRDGHSVAETADLTGVPAALVDLIGQELGQPGRQAHVRPQRVSRNLTMLVLVQVGAMANIIVCVVALLGRSTGMGVLSGIAAVVLTATIWLLARRLAPQSAPHDRRRCWKTRGREPRREVGPLG